MGKVLILLMATLIIGCSDQKNENYSDPAYVAFEKDFIQICEPNLESLTICQCITNKFKASYSVEEMKRVNARDFNETDPEGIEFGRRLELFADECS